MKFASSVGLVLAAAKLANSATYTIRYYASSNCDDTDLWRGCTDIDQQICCVHAEETKSYIRVKGWETSGVAGRMIYTARTGDGGCGAQAFQGRTTVCTGNDNPFRTAFTAV